MTPLTFDADHLARLGEQIVKLFSPPPVVTRILLDRRAGQLRRRGELMGSLHAVVGLYGNPVQLVRLAAFGECQADPIPWYGLRAAHIQQIADYYRGRLSPKAQRRLCRLLVEGMTIVHEAGRITGDDMKAIRQAVGGT